MCPTPRAPISATRNRVSASSRASGERQPDLVVEVAVRRDGRTGRLQDLSQQVLGRGLALGAGDGRDPQAAGARRGRPGRGRSGPAPAAGRRSAGTGQPRPVRGARPAPPPRRPRTPRPRSRGRRRVPRAARRRASPAATWRESTTTPETRTIGAGLSPRAGRDSAPSSAATSASADRDHGASLRGRGAGELGPRRPDDVDVVEGQDPPADLLAGLVALAEHRHHVGAARRASDPVRWRCAGRRRRAPRPRGRTRRWSCCSAWAPRRISARIAAGSSDRGLSSVTTTTSAPATAAAPIGSRLSGIAVAAAAEHRPPVAGRRAPQHGGHGLRGVGEVDDHRRAPGGQRHPLHPARHAGLGEPAGRAASRSTPARSAMASAVRALRTLKSPGRPA